MAPLVNMIGKVAPIMTFEMVMRRFYDEQDIETAETDSKAVNGEESQTWVLPNESEMEEIESNGRSHEGD